MAFLGPALSLLGTGAQMYGEYQAGSAQQEALNIQAAQLYEQGREKIEAIGEEEVQMAGAQIAAYAKAGVMLSGSPLDVMLHTATNFEYDKLMAKYTTESAASAARYKGRMAMLGAIGEMGQSLTNWGVKSIMSYGTKIPTKEASTFDFGPSSESLAS